MYPYLFLHVGLAAKLGRLLGFRIAETFLAIFSTSAIESDDRRHKDHSNARRVTFTRKNALESVWRSLSQLSKRRSWQYEVNPGSAGPSISKLPHLPEASSGTRGRHGCERYTDHLVGHFCNRTASYIQGPSSRVLLSRTCLVPNVSCATPSPPQPEPSPPRGCAPCYPRVLCLPSPVPGHP